MPEYLAPGVYIEELSTGPRPIEGVSTSTAAFIGITDRGPEYPLMVSSWLEYQRWFGGHRDGLYLPYVVQGFFENDGQRLFIARITGGLTGDMPTHRVLTNLTISAIRRGD